MVNLYTTTIPVFIRGLSNMLRIIRKAERYAKQKSFETSVIINTRLAPDQFSFTQQIQYMYFSALDATCGLSGKQMPNFTYEETTLDELKKSIQRTITFLRKVKPQHLKHASERMIPYYFKKEKSLIAPRYVLELSLPQFYFHYTTAYAILRHLGTPLGMDDFTGKLPGLS